MNDSKNYWRYFRILTIIGVAVVVIIIAYFIGANNNFKFSYSHEKSHASVYEQTDYADVGEVAVEEPAIQASTQVDSEIAASILDSYSREISGVTCHFYEGDFIYGSKRWPIMLAFIEEDGVLSCAIYKNMTAKAVIKMGLTLDDDDILLEGKDGNNRFRIKLDSLYGDEIGGDATDGPTHTDVEISPSYDSFYLSKYL